MKVRRQFYDGRYVVQIPSRSKLVFTDYLLDVQHLKGLVWR